jgi:hypothetical protein
MSRGPVGSDAHREMWRTTRAGVRARDQIRGDVDALTVFVVALATALATGLGAVPFSSRDIPIAAGSEPRTASRPG